MTAYDKIDYCKLINNYERWWNKELDRPLISVTLSEDKNFNRGDLIDLVYDTNKTENQIVDVYNQYYSKLRFLGDGYPHFYVRTTGVLGVFMGQNYTISKSDATAWYHKIDGVNHPDDLKFSIDHKNFMWKRTLNLMEKFEESFKGDVVLSGANLGGVCDIYHSMRGLQETLLDLFDYPEEVLRSFRRIYENWIEAYEIIQSKIDPNINHGYSHWTPILSQKPFDMIQADLAFMVSPEDFDKFIMKTLDWEMNYFDRTMFHIDGPGFLNHIDKLLSLPNLDGVQWIPGAGVDGVGHWEDLYEKISNADKLLQVEINGEKDIPFIDRICSCFSDPSRIIFICKGSISEQASFEKILLKYVK